MLHATYMRNCKVIDRVFGAVVDLGLRFPADNATTLRSAGRAVARAAAALCMYHGDAQLAPASCSFTVLGRPDSVLYRM